MEPHWNQYVDLPSRENAFALWYERLTKHRRISYLELLEEAVIAFSPGERLILYVCSALLGVSALFLLNGMNALVSVELPSPGGYITEGEIGPARFINPLLALSTADQDLTALVYSGLTRRLPDGSIIPDLASSYTISPDGRTYTFHIRPGATFHDGSKVTSTDVVYTIAETVNPDIDSSRRPDWTGVGVSAPDDTTVVFTLPHAYAPFLENTTMGILPKHVWENVPAEEYRFSTLDTHPIGSGPYKIDSLTTDSTGAATRYDLSAFESYTLGRPHISKISFVFYPNAESLVKALSSGRVNSAAALSPEDLAGVKRDDMDIAEVALPRVFGVFYNQSHNQVLADLGVRRALEASVDKQEIITAVLSGRGEILNGPIPPELLGKPVPATPQKLADIVSSASSTADTLIANARAILQKDGWSYDDASHTWKKDKKTLSFVLATADQPELVATAKALIADWQALGAQVSLQVYPLSELNVNVIRPRNYDALLFGEVVGPEVDLYAFWHSSQRQDPGLNLSLYANPKTDALLSEARSTTDKASRDSLYEQFQARLTKDSPALFLYAPDFMYIVPRNIYGVELGALRSPSDRFLNVYQWYSYTERVWNVFAPKIIK